MRVLQAVGRALLWAVVTGALAALLGAAITACVVVLVGVANASDVVDGVVGVAIVFGGLAGLICALVMPRARPAKRLATALGTPLRALDRRMSDTALHRRQQAFLRQHPVQAAISYGGAWGVLMFAWSPLLGADYTPTALITAVLFGVVTFGPLFVWLARRRQR